MDFFYGSFREGTEKAQTWLRFNYNIRPNFQAAMILLTILHISTEFQSFPNNNPFYFGSNRHSGTRPGVQGAPAPFNLFSSSTSFVLTSS